MSKAHRGAGIRNVASRGRGECPLCKRSAVKVLYEQEIDGQKVKVCKICNAALKNKARKDKPVVTPSAASEAASVSESAE